MIAENVLARFQDGGFTITGWGVILIASVMVIFRPRRWR